jgi:tRNA 5-methylaminomethyl-2-thiouridine biosynthesis bifunctional protein
LGRPFSFARYNRRMSSPSPLTWTEDGQPRSRLYGDVYFSAEDGLAESRAVFLQGCGMPEAWGGRERFVVGELGFGSGLNILALMDLWRRTTPQSARLHVFSIEAHPISAQEAARALAHWPELSELSALLTSRWPGSATGFHRIDIPEARTTIDLAVMDVEAALEGWTGAADAWFLDGFSPALNPAMWREEILALVARRSAPGSCAATFTVAGAVRRGLAAAGFEVEKKPGFGRKRERLEARLPGAVMSAPPPRVAVVGAGIAGASLARAFRALGCEPIILEAQAPGAGASGNPAALVTPRLDAGLGPVAALFAQALRRSTELYEATPQAVLSRGVLQLAQDERDRSRFEKIAGSDLFEPAAMEMADAGTASAVLGEAVTTAALHMRSALTVEPAAILAAWLGASQVARVAGMRREGERWVLLDGEGRPLAEVDAVVLAVGAALDAFVEEPAISPVRGQVSWCADDSLRQAAAWGGYAAPAAGRLLFGATHDRGDVSTEVRAEDHQRNLATLAAALPDLAAGLETGEIDGRASLRATTSDHLPLAGAAPDLPGVHMLGGLGSRGFCLAPLLAEHVAAGVVGAPSPLPSALAELVDPARFRRRAERKGRSLPSAKARTAEPAKGG